MSGDLEVPPNPPPKSSPLQLPTLDSLSSLEQSLVIPLTPTTPITPDHPTEPRPKKSPLVDLVDTEKTYVDQLTAIIRKVAAAWSRSNLPPRELDTMFRSIEGIYKANRALQTKLKEIGTNPSSPKALGDLLMRWIDDLETPYTVYCTKYVCGFDEWEPVQSNPKLPQVIETFSESSPSPTSAAWTLDALFLLPKGRLKYYRKLYARLLKSTTPGRSDHRLLVGALDKLDHLLDTLEARQTSRVGAAEPKPPELSVDDQVVVDFTALELNTKPDQPVPEPELIKSHLRTSDADPSSSASSSVRGSSSSATGERFSGETTSTSVSRTSLVIPVSDLERRLSTQQTIDIFTMQPKMVRLQMSPPGLTFTREMRCSVDASISFTPRSTGVEVVHPNGHIFILSDLFLVCERMSVEERAQQSSADAGPDMWLCYPPLAGKVLRVLESTEQENVLEIAIMRKETLLVRFPSRQLCNTVLKDLKACIDFAGSLPPPSKQPPPPMPPINGIPGLPVNPRHAGPPSYNSSPTGRSTALRPERNSGTLNSPHMSPPHSRVPSPSSGTLPLWQPGNGRPHSNEATAIRAPSVPLSSPAPPYQEQTASVVPGQIIRSTSVASHMTLDPRQPMDLTSNSSLNPLNQQVLPPPPSQLPRQNPPFPQRNPSQYSQHSVASIQRPPSEPSYQNGVRKSPSTRSFNSQYDQGAAPLPPVPPPMLPAGYPYGSNANLYSPQPRTMLPSIQFNQRAVSTIGEPYISDPSPPNSPIEETPVPTGPVTSSISAQMKCKVFLKQQHAQWKALGAAKLKLYLQEPTNVKQLVVEADNKEKSVLISTIVLTDGVERVGKTGVAIELSDKGARTGIVYMIQLRNENSAGGLFDSLLVGSDRTRK